MKKENLYHWIKRICAVELLLLLVLISFVCHFAYSQGDALTSKNFESINFENGTVTGENLLTPEQCKTIPFVKAYFHDGRIVKTEHYGTGGSKEEEPEKKTVIKLSIPPVAVYEYDSEGRVSKQTRMDWNGTPQEFGGTATHLYEYDEFGREVKITSLDAKGWYVSEYPPIVAKKYDSAGNITEVRYYGPNNKLIENDDGVAVKRIEIKENEQGTVTTTFEYNSMETLLGSTKRIEAEDGNPLEISCYGPYGEPALKYGVFRTTWKYDLNGKEIEESNYGADGQLSAGPDSSAMHRTMYDAMGREVELRFYDAQGNLANTMFRSAIQQYKYDDKGQLIEEISLDSQGNLWEALLTGVARTVYRYDKEGNLIEEINYNAIGQIVERIKYDKFGNIVE